MTGAQKSGQVRSVNSQITDAISQTNTLTLGLAPAQSIGTLYQTTAQAVGASIQNAVANQQNLHSLNMAALAQNIQAIMRNTNIASRSGPSLLTPSRHHQGSVSQKKAHHMTMGGATDSGATSHK